MSAASGYTRRGSWTRGLWLYLSSTAVMWILWGLLWAVEIAFVDHSTDEYWGLVVYVVYVVGTLLMVVANLIFWLTLGRLIDARSRRAWAWYLFAGVVLGAWLAVGLRDANPYALIVGGIIAVGGFMVGPAVAQRAYGSVPWRIGVGITMALGGLSLIAAVL